MDRTLKNAIHKAWEAAHKQGEAFEPEALTCFDVTGEGEIEQTVRHETRATNDRHHTQVSAQVLGRTGAPTTIEKGPESASAVRIEKMLPKV